MGLLSHYSIAHPQDGVTTYRGRSRTSTLGETSDNVLWVDMGNERLRSALHQAGLTTHQLAEAVEVDPKTVERWLSNGRLPHQRHRAQASTTLNVDEAYLWPELLDSDRVRATSQAELIALYPNRGAVPGDMWRRLVDVAKSNIDILVYSGLFLIDSHPDLPGQLIKRAEDGLATRLLYGDPDSEIVASRGIEEGIGENLAARIRLSLTYLQPVQQVPGIELRQHHSILYNSIYRFDDEMLVNTHVLGSPAGKNPVLHIQRLPGGRLFEHYLESFDKVWISAATGQT